MLVEARHRIPGLASIRALEQARMTNSSNEYKNRWRIFIFPGIFINLVENESTTTTVHRES